jgi:hypothetical protein
MGYEIRLHIGQITSQKGFTEKGKTDSFWFQEMARLDLCGGCLSFDVSNCTPAFIFASDGDTCIEEDKYGDKLMAIPIQRVIDALKPKIKSDYVRYSWAYKMLKMMSETGKKHGKRATHCILFGH